MVNADYLTEQECYQLEHAIEWATAMYPVLGRGRHRITFDVQNGQVLKLPHCIAGIHANLNEVYIFDTWVTRYRRHHTDTPAYAWCQSYQFEQVTALLMEKVRPIDVYRNRYAEYWPSWVGSIDCGQVGYTVDDLLVAYDYAG